MSYHGRFEQAKQPKQPGKKKGLKIFLIVIAVILVLLLILAGAAYLYLQSKLKKMNIIELPKDTYAYTEPTDEVTRPPETGAAETTEATTEATVPKMTADDIVNILFVGQAARAGEEETMADSTMLISINTYTKEITCMSILRDSFVKLPDYKGHQCGKAKFTVCYNLGHMWGDTAGAMEMTNICLKDNFGVEVDYNVEISFDSFIKMIDYIDGVDIDLTQAEAVMDIINSKNEYSLKASVKQVKGDVKNEIQHLREQLLSKVALIEATLDDPEHYSFDERFYSETSDMIDSVISEVNLILSKSKNGIVLKEGIKTVIAGKPNVGKSSIMNYLLNDEKAIVTDIPGTTRDVIEYTVNMDNVTLNLVDTAGIHETDNLIEQIGIDRTKLFIEDADLILCVFDSSRSPDDEDIEIYDMVKDKRHICIYNKCDIDKYSSDYIDIIGNTNIIRFSTKEKY